MTVIGGVVTHVDELTTSETHWNGTVVVFDAGSGDDLYRGELGGVAGIRSLAFGTKRLDVLAGPAQGSVLLVSDGGTGRTARFSVSGGPKILASQSAIAAEYSATETQWWLPGSGRSGLAPVGGSSWTLLDTTLIHATEEGNLRSLTLDDGSGTTRTNLLGRISPGHELRFARAYSDRWLLIASGPKAHELIEIRDGRVGRRVSGAGTLAPEYRNAIDARGPLPETLEARFVIRLQIGTETRSRTLSIVDQAPSESP